MNNISKNKGNRENGAWIKNQDLSVGILFFADDGLILTQSMAAAANNIDLFTETIIGADLA